MKIELHEITVRELVANYVNSEVEGVVAYGGKLDVRPKYQREFIYSPKQQEAVIDTVTKGYPLNVMYWSVRGDGTFEVIDGQQRTLSICEYVAGRFAFQFRYFGNLAEDERARILDYPLMVYFCEGTESETWTADLKRYFSKPNGPAYGLGNRYMKGDPIRQDYVATVLRWMSGGDVKGYMARRQNEPSAMDEWLYFKGVIDWVQTLFPKYRREMKGLDWGRLHGTYVRNAYDPAQMEERIVALMADAEVGRKGGVYEYLLGGEKDERLLSLRTFDEADKRTVYERQGRKCAICGKAFAYEDMAGDHVVPWSKGGRTKLENLQMLCVTCNLKKGACR